MDMTMFRRRGLLLNTPHIVNESGSIVTFDSAYNKVPIKSLICNIEPIQSGSGDPSPENVRPISGRTGLSVVRRGKNLFSTDSCTSKYIYRATIIPDSENKNAFLLTGSRGSMDNPQLTVNSWAYYQMLFENITVKKDTTISVTVKLHNYTQNCNGYVSLRHIKDGVVSNSDDIFYFNDVGNIAISLTAVIPAGSAPILQLSPASSSSTVVLEKEVEVTDFQMEFGAPTDYEPYKGSTYSVNWETEAGTVYGGTVDIVSGKLVVDKAKITFDGTQPVGAANWRPYDDSSAWLYYPSTTPGIDNIAGKVENLMCDKLKPIPYTYADGGIYGDNVGVSLVGPYIYAIGMRVPVSGLTTAVLINEWLVENPITVVYKLAKPTEIQLTPQEIKTLLGMNNIWCDSGDVTVDYWKWGK